MNELNQPQPRLEKINKVMKKATSENRQVWIIDRLIEIWDAEALKIIEK